MQVDDAVNTAVANDGEEKFQENIKVYTYNIIIHLSNSNLCV